MTSLTKHVARLASSAHVAALDGRRVAVIGGTGVIGSRILEVLATRRRHTGNDRTTLVSVSRTSPCEEHRIPFVSYECGSVLDATFVRSLMNVDYAVFAVGPTSDYAERPIETVRIASEGVQAMIDGQVGSAGLAVLSSGRIYGPQATTRPVTEADACTIVSPSGRNIYDGAKLISEGLCATAARHGRRIVIARVANVYGPHNGSPPTTPLVRMAEEAMAKRTITVTGAPSGTRNYVFVLDVVDGLLRALTLGRSGEAYNIASRDHLSNADVANRIAAAMHEPTTVVHANPNAPIDHMQLSIAKAVSELQYEPHWSADEAIPLTIRAILAQRASG